MVEIFPSHRVAIEIVGLQIHWYGLMYFLAFLVAYYLLPTLQKYRGCNLTTDQWSSILVSAVLGVIIGGRLGYVFLYSPVHFLTNPLTIVKIWEGGMSSHGGFIGVAVSMYLSSKKHQFDLWSLADIAVVPIAIGLALGRIGNFINGELYGVVTDVPWGMRFLQAEGIRHPVQLYAVAKNLLTAGMCYVHLVEFTHAKNGQTASLFLILYGLFRFSIEYVREQTVEGLHLGFIYLTRGQVLTVPVIIIGVVCWLWTYKRSLGE